MGFLLFIIALILIFFLTIVNYWYVKEKSGYFRSTAKNLDIFANREFRATWNAVLIYPDGYQFGKEGETLSSALGKNQLGWNKNEVITTVIELKPKGWWLVKRLNLFGNNHCINAIDK